MSAEHCPDCLWGGFKRIGNIDECLFCGWRGDVTTLPRLELPEHLNKFLDERKLKRDKEELYFVRVQMNEPSTKKEIVELLFCRTFGPSTVNGQYVFEVWGKLPQEILDKIKAMKGVEWVKLF
ncbi:hypothetical protein J4219_07240 [Candidatus Woesearchaeota archaeon]|nr:hypothetical protein [Candidatus Woesearchaeota archaeon]